MSHFVRVSLAKLDQPLPAIAAPLCHPSRTLAIDNHSSQCSVNEVVKLCHAAWQWEAPGFLS